MPTNCPCGSGATYQDCCGKFISGGVVVATPEQLMRSRYTAYTMVDLEYIKQTMRGIVLQGFDEYSAGQWARKANWLSLEIVRVSKYTSNYGEVEFKAYYEINAKQECLHENSVFHKIAGSWYYVSSKPTLLEEQMATLSRNDPCICGSGKKYKKCCYIKNR